MQYVGDPVHKWLELSFTVLVFLLGAGILTSTLTSRLVPELLAVLLLRMLRMLLALTAGPDQRSRSRSGMCWRTTLCWRLWPHVAFPGMSVFAIACSGLSTLCRAGTCCLSTNDAS